MGPVSVEGGAAFVNGAGAFAGGEEAEVFAGDDFGDGEAVVNLGHVHIIGGDAGHLVSLTGGFLGRREGGQLIGVVQGLARGLPEARPERPGGR